MKISVFNISPSSKRIFDKEIKYATDHLNFSDLVVSKCLASGWSLAVIKSYPTFFYFSKNDKC